MCRRIIALCLISFITAGLNLGCASLGLTRSKEISPFKTDGCSLFPDGTFKDKTKWRDCCIDHDISYWKGGTEEDRRNADIALRDCILEKTGDSILAEMVYDAVRVWGGPLYPSWYRWGYGWSYGRPYRELTPEERAQAAEKLHLYVNSGATDSRKKKTPGKSPQSSPGRSNCRTDPSGAAK